jgi:hypothetical protein
LTIYFLLQSLVPFSQGLLPYQIMVKGKKTFYNIYYLEYTSIRIPVSNVGFLPNKSLPDTKLENLVNVNPTGFNL